LFINTNISQSSVAKRLRCGAIYNVFATLLLGLRVKHFIVGPIRSIWNYETCLCCLLTIRSIQSRRLKWL